MDSASRVGRPPAAGTVELRPVGADATPFLIELYASTRAEELALMPWDEAGKAAFSRMQFDAQDQHYRAQFPLADRLLVLVDGRPAGRLYVDRRLDEVRVVDISLLPEFRGHGIGTALLRELIDEAASTGRPLRLHVGETNRARTLYARLGFRGVSRGGGYELMEYLP